MYFRKATTPSKSFWQCHKYGVWQQFLHGFGFMARK
jgi:hypothetical protein